jgi:lipopolysaccharide/colanic/teichoic acid biosynthesis glycosyltransferase
MAGLELWKRILDVLLSTVALILLTPFVAFVALLVKMTSSGEIIFKQERIGVDRRTSSRRYTSFRRPEDDRRASDRRVLVKFGRPFTIFKFRTMCAGAEKGAPVFAQHKDPRVTTLGRFLRKTRVDEIPQFVNVLRGDMSIVGPRPERAYFIGEAQKDMPDFKQRLRTRPGITGLAQVKLGYTSDIGGLKKKLDYDLEYIQGLRPANDLKILAQTVRVVLTGKGAV